MQVALNLNQNELNQEFLSLMKQLFTKDNISEVIIKKEKLIFEEFDTTVPYEEIIKEISGAGYSADFVNELGSGLKKTVY